MVAINPYLTFDGNCEEAFDFYKSVFGTEFMTKNKFREMPAENNMPADDGEKIMHVSLPVGNTTLMGSDRVAMQGEGTMGNNFSISVVTDTEDEATSIFNKLSSGGTITMPLQKTFWNAYFGMLTDRFAIQWMVNYDYK